MHEENSILAGSVKKEDCYEAGFFDFGFVMGVFSMLKHEGCAIRGGFADGIALRV